MELPEESAAAAGDQARRRACTTGCGRPINVCLCHALPSTPFPTATKVVILHHPHERRCKLATVPLLSKCLQNCEIIVGRKLKYGQSELLDSLYDQACETPNLPLGRALYLFPGPNALPFFEFNRANSSPDDVSRNDLVLIVFDGTWKHAKEMVLASLSFLSKFAIQVCLDFDAGIDGGTIYDSDLILRKEPFAGCMSTMEAVARCLRVLEPNGIDIESRIIEVLRAMQTSLSLDDGNASISGAYTRSYNRIPLAEVSVHLTPWQKNSMKSMILLWTSEKLKAKDQDQFRLYLPPKVPLMHRDGIPIGLSNIKLDNRMDRHTQ